MHYTATHKSLPTPAVVGCSDDARWRGLGLVRNKAKGLNSADVHRWQLSLRKVNRAAVQ